MFFLFQGLCIKVGWGDDSWFINILPNINVDSVFSFLKSRYFEWSSRFIIEFFLVFFVKHRVLWRILNAVVNTLTAFCLAHLTGTLNSQKFNFLCCFSIFFIPQGIFCNTGWVATTLNYSWPLLFGLVSLVYLKKLMDNKKMSWFDWAIFTFSLLFASNQEQMCVALLLCVATLFIYNRFLNKCSLIVFFLPIMIIVFSTLFIITCPGNSNRYHASVLQYFPDFTNLSSFRKLEIGFSSTFYELIVSGKLLFFAFSVLILICMISKKSGYLRVAISSFPIVVFLMFNIFYKAFPQDLEGIREITSRMGKYGSGASINDPTSLVLDLIFILLIASVIFSLYFCLRDQLHFFISIFTLIVGFISRMLTSFSPSIWASSERTFLFFYFSIVLVVAFIQQSIYDRKIREFSFYFSMFIACMSSITSLCAGQH